MIRVQWVGSEAENSAVIAIVKHLDPEMKCQISVDKESYKT